MSRKVINVIVCSTQEPTSINMSETTPTTTTEMPISVFVNPTIVQLNVEDVKMKKSFVLTVGEYTFNLQYFSTEEQYTFVGINETAEVIVKLSVTLNEDETEFENITLMQI